MIVFCSGFSKLLFYFAICATSALVLRRTTSISDELFRKVLHTILLGSAPVFLYIFETWQSSALAAVGFAALAYPALSLAEHWQGYSGLLVERNRGEIKKSLIVVFGMFASVITICWGIIGAKYLALAVVLGWGLGDAAAALIGKKFGRHRLVGRFLDGKKTLEGTAAMFVVSFVSIISVLLFSSTLSWSGSMFIAAVTAAVGSIVELNTKNGFDTLTCPLAMLVVMLPLIHLWAGVP